MTIKPKIGQYRGKHNGKFVSGYMRNLNEFGFEIESTDKLTYGIVFGCSIDSLGQFTGQFAKISPELASAQPWRDVCSETGLTEIVGGYGPGVERGGDLIEIPGIVPMYVSFLNGSFRDTNIGPFAPLHERFIDYKKFGEPFIIGTAWEGE